jgi:photosystem II stability/assembly factor-like uncharacterized protein
MMTLAAMKKYALVFLLTSAFAAEPTLPDLLNSFPYRNLGPFRAGAWVVDVAVPETPAKLHQRTFYTAARTGGVWKTSNNGTTFENVTDSAGLASIGAVAVAPSNADIVWVGSGDNTVTRSALYGDGVYRSTDGGKQWTNMGLSDTQHIARIVIHPSNPDVVWVAAIGHLFSRNAERGVFKTTDGGRTWKKVLYVNDSTGAIDLVIDHRHPNVLYTAMYEYMRYPWRLVDGGEGSGIFKSSDGGATWQRLAGGLPKGKLGRIGIDICRSQPDVLYAVIDNFNAKANGQPIGGEVYRTDDGGRTWRKTSADSDDVSRKAGYSFNQLRVDPNTPDKVYITGSNLLGSTDAGKTWAGLGRGFERPFRRAFGDFRSLWIDPEDSDRMIATSDGGVFISYDGGKTCDHFSNLQLGEVYALGVDMATPYRIYAGLQDHENWSAPVDGPNGSVGIEDWVTTGIGDGMYNEPDPNGRWLYNTQEFGRHARVDLEQHTRTVIAPTRPQGQPFLRFNWTAPIRLSPHDGRIVYAGAQVLFKSTDRGDHWQEISPDLTTNDPDKITRPGGSIQHCTITTIDESPAQAGVIWVGSDDGKVQVTRDGGAHWSDVSPGPPDAWVTRVSASRFEPGTAYVTKSRRRQDDFRPFVFRTTDFGATWAKIADGLPDAAANVIVEDIVNRDLLFVGLDKGVYVSFDRGARWMPLKANMPMAPVADMVVHAREGDLVVATFGRGIWVATIGPLRELVQASTESAFLFTIRPFTQRREGVWGNWRLFGDRYQTTQNEPNGITVVYYLKEAGTPTVSVTDSNGTLVRKLNAPGKQGINRAVWNLDDAQNRPTPAGEYVVTLDVGDRKLTQKARLNARAPEDSPRPRFGQ